MGRAIRVTSLIALLAIVAAACGTDTTGRQPASDAARSRLTTTTTISPPEASTTSTTAPTTTTTIAPTTTTTIAGGTASNPLPAGDPDESVFVYDDFGTTWDGLILGVVASPLSQFNDDEGNCVLVLGVLRPTAIRAGIATSGFDTPSIELLVGGRLVDSDVTACDRDDAERSGFGWRLDAEVTVDTDYPFYEAFFFPGDEPPSPSAILVGRPSEEQARYFEARSIGGLPAIEIRTGPAIADTGPVLGAGTEFTYEGAESTWTGSLQGIVETPLARFNSATGICLALIGQITPTTIESGSVSNPFDSPPVNLIVGGRVIGSDVTQCDRDELEASGYGWRLDAEVTVDTEFRFYEAYFFEDADDVVIDVIAVGSPSGDDVLVFEAAELIEVP